MVENVSQNCHKTAGFNDQDIYVCGGRNGGTIWNSCEVYSIRSNTWTKFPAMPHALEGNAMTVITTNMQIVSFGGYNGDTGSDTNAV